MRASAPSVYIPTIKSFHEMKGDRDGKSVQKDTAYSAVVVNDHMYPRPYHFYCFYDPFDDIGTGIPFTTTAL